MAEQSNADLIANAEDLIEKWDRAGSWTPDSPIGVIAQLVTTLKAAEQRVAGFREALRVQTEETMEVAKRSPFKLTELQLAAVTEERNQLAAVIEKAEDYVTRHYLDTQMGTNVLTLLVGDDPADVLREVKADVWDEGATAASEGYDLPDAAQIHNPYRDEQS